MAETRDKMEDLEKNLIDVGRCPDDAMNRISGPMMIDFRNLLSQDKEHQVKDIFQEKTKIELQI